MSDEKTKPPPVPKKRTASEKYVQKILHIHGLYIGNEEMCEKVIELLGREIERLDMLVNKLETNLGGSDDRQ